MHAATVFVVVSRIIASVRVTFSRPRFVLTFPHGLGFRGSAWRGGSTSDQIRRRPSWALRTSLMATGRSGQSAGTQFVYQASMEPLMYNFENLSNDQREDHLEAES